MHILLIEDDPEAAQFLQTGLQPEGHKVSVENDGRSGLIIAATGTFDLLILERSLPGLDGLAILRVLREVGVQTPALFLTMMDGIAHRVEGLRAGADDYLVKPFVLEELSARIAALARRRTGIPKNFILRIADLELNRLNQVVRRAGEKIDLKPREFKLLEYLMLHENQVVTHAMILEDVWNFHFDPKTGFIESHISRLRTKLDRGFNKELIRTFRGSGYRISADN